MVQTQPRSRAQARREAAAQMAREDILDAAEQEFMAHGFRAATMSAIARKAGFTAASLYTYFDSKEAIFKAIGERVMERLSQVLATPMDDDLPVREGLEVRVRALLEFIDVRRQSIKMFFDLQWGVEVDRDPDEPDGTQMCADWFQAYIEASGLPSADFSAEVLTAALMGIIDGFVKRSMAQPDRDSSLVDQTDLIVRLFLGGALQSAASMTKDPS